MRDTWLWVCGVNFKSIYKVLEYNSGNVKALKLLENDTSHENPWTYLGL